MVTATALAQIFIDLPAGTPKHGEFLVTEGVRGIGSIYLILSVREVKRRSTASRRLALVVQRGYSREDVEPGALVWRLRWYKRKATRRKLRPRR